MAMTDAITVHSPGLCVQLLNNGPEQRVDIPLERKAEKVHSLCNTITSLEVVRSATPNKNGKKRSGHARLVLPGSGDETKCYQPKELNRVALHIC